VSGNQYLATGPPFSDRRSVGDDFLYVFKPGRHGPDAPPLAPASARSRSAPRARRAAGARQGIGLGDQTQTLAARQVSGIAQTEQRCGSVGVQIIAPSRRPPQRATRWAGGGKVGIVGWAVQRNAAPAGPPDRATPGRRDGAMEPIPMEELSISFGYLDQAL